MTTATGRTVQGHEFFTREMLEAMGLPWGAVRDVCMHVTIDEPVLLEVEMELLSEATATLKRRFARYRLVEFDDEELGDFPRESEIAKIWAVLSDVKHVWKGIEDIARKYDFLDELYAFCHEASRDTIKGAHYVRERRQAQLGAEKAAGIPSDADALADDNAAN